MADFKGWRYLFKFPPIAFKYLSTLTWKLNNKSWIAPLVKIIVYAWRGSYVRTLLAYFYTNFNPNFSH